MIRLLYPAKRLPLHVMRITVFIVVLIAGCAGLEPDVSSARDSWLDAPYDEIVLRWGTPVRSTKLTDGRDVYTWMSEGTFPSGNVRPSIGISGSSGGRMSIGTGVIFGSGGEFARCERTLIFKDGRVEEQTWQGPVEYCSTFRRN
jgi:hypothetical protein